jgi:hypothetical protein
MSKQEKLKHNNMKTIKGVQGIQGVQGTPIMIMKATIDNVLLGMKALNLLNDNLSAKVDDLEKKVDELENNLNRGKYK